MPQKITFTPSSGDVFADLNIDRRKLLGELHAQADRLLPSPTYARLNALIKAAPQDFAVPARVRLAQGTTHKALSNLAKKIYLAGDEK